MSNESVERTPLLHFDDLQISFKSRGRWLHAVKGISLKLHEQEGIAVIGESGSGKTISMLSSLALVGGQPGVVGGKILYGEAGTPALNLLEDVEEGFRREGNAIITTRKAELWKRDYLRRAQLLAGRKVGIIFQNPVASLDPLWSVGQTICESIRLREPKWSRAEIREEAENWLERVHIKNPRGVMRSYPHQLSGGMCQRVMIATVLALRPQVIIADEPTTGLDMTTKAQVLYLLHEARTRYNSSLIFVTHEIGLVTGLTDRVYVMRHGEVADEIATSDLRQVSFEDGEFQAPESFAEYTRQLLKSSLSLEHSRQQLQAMS